jgi:uncharacterized metal-binding protein
MPDLPERKVGIIACSGEELAVGTVSRLAALKVLHEMRPGKTVTICLPLFLAGGEGDRAFARFHPTITVDGCELRCAARGTELYSGKPTASVVISDVAAEHHLETIDGRRKLNEAGVRAVEITSKRVAALVDEILATQPPSTLVAIHSTPPLERPSPAGCSCGSGIPISKINIGGKTVELLALPLIFQRLHELRRAPEVAGDELLDTVKIYNSVPDEEEKEYRAAIIREYAAFCQEVAQ